MVRGSDRVRHVLRNARRRAKKLDMLHCGAMFRGQPPLKNKSKNHSSTSVGSPSSSHPLIILVPSSTISPSTALAIPYRPHPILTSSRPPLTIISLPSPPHLIFISSSSSCYPHTALILILIDPHRGAAQARAGCCFSFARGRRGRWVRRRRLPSHPLPYRPRGRWTSASRR